MQLSRRQLPHGRWHSIVFDDYVQESDDGHNVVCIGISHGDGSFHISWDLHSSRFNYRTSRVDLVTNPSDASWRVESFGPILHRLPGLEQNLDEVSSLLCNGRGGTDGIRPHIPVFCRCPLDSAGRCYSICEQGSLVLGMSGCTPTIKARGPT